MRKDLIMRGRQVEITTGAAPEDARLIIDGTEIPLVYHSRFRGWGVAHTIYGFFQDLEKLADHIIVSNPTLEIGHGGGHGDHGGGHGGHD